MKIQFNTTVKVGNVFFEAGDEYETYGETGNELVSRGVAGVLEHDAPKKREPKSIMKKEVARK